MSWQSGILALTRMPPRPLKVTRLVKDVKAYGDKYDGRRQVAVYGAFAIEAYKLGWFSELYESEGPFIDGKAKFTGAKGYMIRHSRNAEGSEFGFKFNLTPQEGVAHSP